MIVSILVARASNGTIGRDGGLPWRLPRDLKRFKRLTMGHHILMGRKTWESIGRALPGRTSVVVSRDGGYAVPEGVRLAGSLEAAFRLAQRAGEDEAFVIGGGEIYALALPRADRIYLTEVEAAVDGDAAFPPLDPERWVQVAADRHPADARHDHPYRFVVLERR
jgi:dihydrofolate reductase